MLPEVNFRLLCNTLSFSNEGIFLKRIFYPLGSVMIPAALHDQQEK